MDEEIQCIEVSDSDEEKASEDESTTQNVTTKDILDDVAAATLKNAPVQQQTKNRRKDKLEPMESEYEIITLNDKDEKAAALKSKKLLSYKYQLIHAKKRAQNQSKKEKWKSVPRNTDSPAQKLNNACEDLLNNAETEEILKNIAMERVRVNYLLASYSMPDINFCLGSELNALLFQLNERLRQRSIRYAKNQQNK